MRTPLSPVPPAVTEPDRSSEDRPPTRLQVIASVAASFFGVQSSRNRRRDFTHGKAQHYIAVALVMTVVVALVIYGAVKLAIHLAR